MRRLAPNTVHVLDAGTRKCLCHTRWMPSVPSIGRALGRRVVGVYEWQLRLQRLLNRFQTAPSIVIAPFTPSPALSLVERPGIAGHITPAEATATPQISSRESFNRNHYERVLEARQYRGDAA